MSRAFARFFAAGMVLLASSSPACRADESVLNQVFSCDPEAGDAQCGTDENGKPMTCYVGSAQLGGKAFCTKSCDPTLESDSGFFCTSSGALLETCHPTQNDVRCRSPLNCYRTDVLLDDGLCLLVPVCPYSSDGVSLDDGQCPFARPFCAGSLLRDAAGPPLASALEVNNLHCVSRDCRDGFDCPQGGLPEVCPDAFYAFDYGLPTFCASPCDRFTCPPNFACAGSSGFGAQSVCLPGVPGMRCRSPADCLSGDCVDTGAGFSVCTLLTGCSTDDDCLSFVGQGFVCARGDVEADTLCVPIIPFQGENCESAADCSLEGRRCGAEACPPRKCSHHSPFEVDPMQGECRFACDAESPCPAFGGVPHVCLEDGGCYPGRFGVPCSTRSDCLAKLTCGTVPPDVRSRSDAPSICTVPCSVDEDCILEANPWLGDGYCVPAPDPPAGFDGYCRPGAPPGSPCDVPAHCASRDCAPTNGGPSECK